MRLVSFYFTLPLLLLFCSSYIALTYERTHAHLHKLRILPIALPLCSTLLLIWIFILRLSSKPLTVLVCVLAVNYKLSSKVKYLVGGRWLLYIYSIVLVGVRSIHFAHSYFTNMPSLTFYLCEIQRRKEAKRKEKKQAQTFTIFIQ